MLSGWLLGVLGDQGLAQAQVEGIQQQGEFAERYGMDFATFK